MKASNIPPLLNQIRPHLNQIRPQWQGKNLIDRVRRLLEVDPSSACQRVFNASIHDLREKVVIAGLDIAKEAADQNGLPSISKEEDVERYSTAKLIDLAYRMGLLTRPEWRRVKRCYEIRRDLEHEDDEYEAGIEDCVYIFSTCINVVLSVDPVQLLKVKDVKDIVEQAASAIPDDSLVADYQRAPQTRQEEILKFLISLAMDKTQTDIVQQNAFAAISYLQPRTQKSALLNIGRYLQDDIGRAALETRQVRVAQAAGVLPYLRETSRNDFFTMMFRNMVQTGYRWTAYQNHGELLRSFQEFGAFSSCPGEPKLDILKWLTLAYIGEPGGQTSWGNVRHVFYSNCAAPIIEEIAKTDAALIKDDLFDLTHDKEIKQAIGNQHVARRFENLLDIVSAD